MDKEFEKKLKELLYKINIEINEKQIKKFYDYMTLLIEWNKKINLTTVIEPKDIIIKHFVDSLTIIKYINEGEKIADVGTGAGFPGVPISILKENNQIQLIDSLNKRINFLNEVKQKLGLKNVNTIHARAEDIGQNKIYREQFDFVTSRAVANLSTLSEYLIPLTKRGGKIVCMKANNIEEEIKNAKFAIKELGGKINSVDELFLPGTDMKRTIVVIEKVQETKKIYPRKAGIPSKQPLKNKS